MVIQASRKNTSAALEESPYPWERFPPPPPSRYVEYNRESAICPEECVLAGACIIDHNYEEEQLWQQNLSTFTNNNGETWQQYCCRPSEAKLAA